MKFPISIATALGSMLALSLACRTEFAWSSPPNIIFVMADDLGYGDLGCFGQRQIRTPNIDRLAREGLRFTQCYAGSAECAPSRCVLMTGRHTGHCRVRANRGVCGGVPDHAGKRRVPLHDRDVTVAEVLKRAGYATGIAGKWGLGEPATDGIPNRQGFDCWFGFLNQNIAHSYYPDSLWLNGKRFDLPGNAAGRRQQYAHDLFTGFALHFVRSHRDRPFFLYLPYTIPHAQLEVPDLGDYAAKSDWSPDARTYAAMVSRLDADIGRLLALLEELQIDDRTLVFFCSDNGAARRHAGVFDSSGLLRGQKRDMYEGGLRTPMIARWPGLVPANGVSDAPWGFVDFLATVAELAAVSPIPQTDGTSVLPTLLGKAQASLHDRLLYWELPTSRDGLRQAARQGHWKVVRQSGNNGLELYNLWDDPAECRNLAGSYPALVAEMERYLAAAHTEAAEWPSQSAAD